MSSISIAGDSSGAVTLAAPAIAGTNTMTLLAATGTLGPKVQGTAVASTSGTAIDFTSIPSWVTRLTVMFSGVSMNASSEIQIQIGSGSITTSGYGSACARLNAGGTGLPAASFTSGFALTNGYTTPGTVNGFVFIVAMPNLFYGYSSNFNTGSSGNTVMPSTGSVTLSGVLDRIRITSVSGTAAFSAGSINIMYE